MWLGVGIFAPPGQAGSMAGVGGYASFLIGRVVAAVVAEHAAQGTRRRADVVLDDRKRLRNYVPDRVRFIRER